MTNIITFEDLVSLNKPYYLDALALLYSYAEFTASWIGEDGKDYTCSYFVPFQEIVEGGKSCRPSLTEGAKSTGVIASLKFYSGTQTYIVKNAECENAFYPYVCLIKDFFDFTKDLKQKAKEERRFRRIKQKIRDGLSGFVSAGSHCATEYGIDWGEYYQIIRDEYNYTPEKITQLCEILSIDIQEEE